MVGPFLQTEDGQFENRLISKRTVQEHCGYCIASEVQPNAKDTKDHFGKKVIFLKLLTSTPPD